MWDHYTYLLISLSLSTWSIERDILDVGLGEGVQSLKFLVKVIFICKILLVHLDIGRSKKLWPDFFWHTVPCNMMLLWPCTMPKCHYTDKCHFILDNPIYNYRRNDDNCKHLQTSPLLPVWEAIFCLTSHYTSYVYTTIQPMANWLF